MLGRFDDQSGIRLLRILNDSGEVIAACAAVRITGFTSTTGTFTVGKPTAASQVDNIAFNSNSDIPIGGESWASVEFPVLALVDPDEDAPAAGDELGTQANSWYLAPGRGFPVLGNVLTTTAGHYAQINRAARSRDGSPIIITSSLPVGSRYPAIIATQTGLPAEWVPGDQVWVYNTQGTELYAGLHWAAARYNTDQFMGLDQLAIDYCCTTDTSSYPACSEVCSGVTEWPTQVCLTVTFPAWTSGSCPPQTFSMPLYGGEIVSTGDVCATWSGFYLSADLCYSVSFTLSYIRGLGFYLSGGSFACNAYCNFQVNEYLSNPATPMDCGVFSLSTSATLTDSPAECSNVNTCPSAGETVNIAIESVFVSCEETPSGGSSCITVPCEPLLVPSSLTGTFAFTGYS